MGSVLTINNVGRTLRIANSYMNSNHTNAIFDEVRIYNRALSADEILQLYKLEARRMKPTQ
jgi:hypothetical protein